MQPATKKCTGCGKVFCDLHIRYGGQPGGMYGAGDVGYYCDACWEAQVVRRRRVRQALVGVGVLLLAMSAVGLLVLRGGLSAVSGGAWVASSLIVLAVLVGVVVVIGLALYTTRRM